MTDLKMDVVKRKKPSCNEAKHDGVGCLGFSVGMFDDTLIEACENCEKYTGNITEQDS